MVSIVISSFFTKKGIPQLGLQPTIRIWEVDGTSQTLIIGSPNGTGNPGTGTGTDGQMLEVVSLGGSPPTRDGFYKFEFTDVMGYDPTKSYLIRSDGGTILPAGERLQTIEIDYAASSAQLDINTINALVVELLKYNKNRTFINKTNFTLTVFDDDGTTPLKVFDLKDEFGVQSITKIFERIPQ